jgi:asparagine synthase (glutamine-hydrolysing)
MCGLVGIVTRRRPSLALMQALCAQLAHRGPDDAGVFITRCGAGWVALGHRRLAVLDPDHAQQPMLTADGHAAIAFNGQVYNHRALRAQAVAARTPMTTDHADTEALLVTLAARGARALPQLDGQFGFAFLDRRRQQLLLARDALGLKPLYVAGPDFFDRGSDIVMAFASELGPLASAPGARPTLGADGLAQLLAYDYVPAPRTIYDEVQQLAPGTVMTVALDALPIALPTPSAFWDVPFRVEASTPSRLEAALERAVVDRLEADVPLGLLLSGGIDSSLVGVLARRHAPSLASFSIGFTHPDFDESSAAQQVADLLGTEHHTLRLSEADISEHALTAVDHLSEPLADHSIVPSSLLYRFAREHVTVAVGGDGGDELTLGYPTFVAERLLQACGRLVPPRALRMAPALGGGEAALQVMHLKRAAAEDDPLERHRVMLTGVNRPLLAAVVPGARSFAPLDLHQAAHKAGARQRFALLTYWYMKTYMASGVLQKVDRMSMRYGLEVRAPFLDTRVVTAAMGLPWSDKLKGATTKAVLRQLAARYFPPSIVRRQKQGFGWPVAEVLRRELRATFERDVFRGPLASSGLVDEGTVGRLWREHLRGLHNHRKVLWSLLVAARFAQRPASPLDWGTPERGDDDLLWIASRADQAQPAA